MNDRFETLKEFAVDPFTWDDSGAGAEGGAPFVSALDREISTAAVAEIAGADWMSCDTCWDPGADEPFPEGGG